ncbi:MAG: 30S ribosomal protein S20 [Marinilabiliales bacterium]|nr:MAG: 30S ribosomal protein S20 [Marinilabiliales bacterium]
MANHKSALKRVRSTQKRRNYNRYYAKTMRNAIRNFRQIEKKDEAAKLLNGLISLIDRNAKRGVIHRNKAANLKSKITKKFNTL